MINFSTGEHRRGEMQRTKGDLREHQAAPSSRKEAMLLQQLQAPRHNL